jgi:hypothetical protein
VKRTALVTCLLTAILVPTAILAQTARSYYDELYKAGGLDKQNDEYVCF